jgi:hypothetical protein
VMLWRKDLGSISLTTAVLPQKRKIEK